MKNQAINAQHNDVTLPRLKKENTRRNGQKQKQKYGLTERACRTGFICQHTHCLHEPVDKASLLTDKASPQANEASLFILKSYVDIMKYLFRKICQC